jgi:hypothetical protein
MTRILTPALAGLTLVVGAAELNTRYDTERKLTVSIETSQTMETVASEMTRDGEPMEGFGGRSGGGGTESSLECTYTDTLLSADEGAPTRMEREYGDVTRTTTVGFGEESRDMDRTSPLDGETLSLHVDGDGDTIAKLKDDGDPEHDDMLKGHSLALPLDGLLPEDEVSEGDSWEPDAAAILTALGLDVQGALFPPEERSGEGWGGRGGGRGGRSWGGSGGGSLRYLNDADWDSEATLTDRTETVQDLECIVIELTFETEGDMPERSFGRGRDRDRSFSAWENPFTLENSERLIESTYEVEIEGHLFYSLAEQRPVKLVLEGEISLETNTEINRDEFSMTIYRLQEGTIEHTVEITAEDA